MGVAAFTPGPWGIEQTINDLWIGPLRAVGRKVDQVVVSVDIAGDLKPSATLRQYRNACLIAAAPDLYAALAEQLSDWDQGAEPTNASVDRMRAALAKARGEA